MLKLLSLGDLVAIGLVVAWLLPCICPECPGVVMLLEGDTEVVGGTLVSAAADGVLEMLVLLELIEAVVIPVPDSGSIGVSIASVSFINCDVPSVKCPGIVSPCHSSKSNSGSVTLTLLSSGDEGGMEALVPDSTGWLDSVAVGIVVDGPPFSEPTCWCNIPEGDGRLSLDTWFDLPSPFNLRFLC